jgi:hypothetical protein
LARFWHPCACNMCGIYYHTYETSHLFKLGLILVWDGLLNFMFSLSPEIKIMRNFWWSGILEDFFLPIHKKMWHSGAKWTWIVLVVSVIWSSGLTTCRLVGVVPMEKCCSILCYEDRFIEMVVPIYYTAWCHISGNWSPDANHNDNPIFRTVWPAVLSC